MRHVSISGQDQPSEAVRERIREQIQAAVDAARAQEDAERAMADAERAVQEAGVRVQREEGGVRIIETPDGARIVVGPNGPLPPGRPGVEVGAAPFIFEPQIPPEAVDIAIGFFITLAVIIVGWPIARALGRRIDRGATTPALGAEAGARLERIEQALEAVAIEVERISESQRYQAKLLTDRAHEAGSLRGNA